MREGRPGAAARFAEGCARRLTARRTGWLFAVLPLLAGLLLIGLVGEAERDPAATDSLPAGLDSTEGVELQERLPESDLTAVVLYTAAEGERLDDVAAELEQHARGLQAVPAAGPAAGPAGGPPGEDAVLLPADDGTAAIAIVPVAADTSTEVADAVGELRERADEGLPEGVETQVTGPAAVQADLAEVFQGADRTLLLVTASVVAILLVITYRSPVLWLVPIVVVGVADRLAAVAATHAMAALGVAWDESTIGILSVLVFGAGTDYALLLISRYRDELRAHESRRTAMVVAWRGTAEAVLASSTTVVVGVLTLTLSLTPATRGLGVASAVGVVVAATAVLVVLPAALVLFGRWVFWPRVPRYGESRLADTRSFWERLGRRVAGAPRAFALGTLALLAVLAVGALGITTGLDVEEQFLDEPEAITAAERLEESFPAGVASPTQVVTTADADQVVATVEEVAAVSSARVGAQGGGVTEITTVIDAEPGSAEAEDAVRDLRTALADLDQTHVVGQEAEALDEAEGAARDRMVIIPLILVLVLGALVLLLRSLVAPVLLVLTVVATYLASMGASWWIATGLLGFTALDSGAPLLAFLFLVALGVDYNIFLVTRAREEAEDHGTRTGMLRALTVTGGVITSAGILLAAVFLVLGVLPLVVLAQLGLIICIGVLLDTLVVRTVLVPALALVLGDRFWWPRRVGG